MSRKNNHRTRFSLQRLEQRDTPSTTLLKDINTPAFFDSDPQGGFEWNDKYYFSAKDQAHGRELWCSDGTPEGTKLCCDINFGAGDSDPYDLAVLNGNLYFNADAGNGRELWKYDGASATMVKDINGANESNPSYLTVVNGTLFFSATTNATGYELWKSDGTDAGTTMVKEIDNSGGNWGPRELTSMGGKLYFQCHDAAGGSELWKSDGSAAGTVRVKDINPGSADSDPSELTVLNGTLYFSAHDVAGGYELWKSDGTAASTVQVKDIVIGAGDSFPSGLTVSNNTLFFRAKSTSNGYELWKSDGTVFGTVAVADINPGAADSYPSNLTDVNGTLFFTASDPLHGNELWKTDGTAAGTLLVKELRNGPTNGNPSSLTNVSGELYFVDYDGGKYDSLLKTDGTAAGTVTVRDFFGGYVNPIGAMDGTLFMKAETDASVGRELWVSTTSRRASFYAVGADAGQLPVVRTYDRETQAVEFNLFAYDPSFKGGVRVAVGDVTGDGVDDIVTSPGAGGGPHIRLFDGVTGQLKKEFYAYDPKFIGGVFVAVADVDKDGYADIITGAGAGGGPHVKVFSGKNLSLITEFFAYGPTFTGGVNVAGGDINGDGYADIITGAGPGGGPHVRVISGQDKKTELRSFFAFDASFNGGVNVAAGDLNADSFEDIITGQASKGQRIRWFNGKDNAMVGDYDALGGAYAGGVRVASADINHDGHADLLCAIPPDDKHVVVLSRVSGSSNTFSGGLSIYDPEFLGGVFVGA